jgi:hypothetical protein
MSRLLQGLHAIDPIEWFTSVVAALVYYTLNSTVFCSVLHANVLLGLMVRRLLPRLSLNTSQIIGDILRECFPTRCVRNPKSLTNYASAVLLAR